MAAHRFDPTILRAYDIRGVVGETVTVDDARAIGRAFGTMAAARNLTGSIAVGYDGRLSSPDLANAVAEGLAAAGRDVIEIGLGPTPMLYYAAAAWDCAGGIQITGSHNPPDYNGFKMTLGGKPFYGDDIQRIGAIAAEDGFASGAGARSTRDASAEYVARMLQDAPKTGDLNVAWDIGNGAAGAVIDALTAGLPGTHHILFGDVDGNFPNHHPDPTEEKNLVDLKAAVAEKGCDLGIAFDGDGDRIGVIDGRGRVIWGDQILLMLAREVLAERPGATIIADVKASQALFDGVAVLGGTPLMWRTGHSLIKAKMKETGSPLAGEMSGHIFFADRYFGFDDALYAAVRLLGGLAKARETDAAASIAAWRDAMPSPANTPEMRFDCPDDEKFAVVERLAAVLAQDGADVTDVDGVRVNMPEGWWLLRASNTQPVLVARCEAADEAGLAVVKAALADALRRADGPTPKDL